QLYDTTRVQTLGLSFLSNIETSTVFKPNKRQNKYNNGVVLYPFKGKLYVQWQSSKTDEDAPETQIFYSVSKDGMHWNKPKALTEPFHQGIKTSGGWFSYQDTLVAFIKVWDEDTLKQGVTHYQLSTDGLHWSKEKPVTSANGNIFLGIIEQDLKKFNNRIITAFHMQPGIIATPCYTFDSLGIRGWHKGHMENLPSTKKSSRELEPSWFYRSDSAIVMIFRDQASSFRKLASVSYDFGKVWSKPVLVDMLDSRSKQCAGNLPHNIAYMVNNPSGTKQRSPLVITLSKDGFVFDKAYLLRSGGDDLQPLLYQGKYKRAGYNYPKSVLWDNYLYVGYATNKEDVEITRIPVKTLQSLF
nr:exo-alpha-sialidase [Bacteroidales bacterium]